MTQSLHELETAAAESGLNLFHVLTQRDLAAAGLPWPVQSPGEPGLLLLFGNGGGKLWRQLALQEEKAKVDGTDIGFADESADRLMTRSADSPVDSASRQLVLNLIANSASLEAFKTRVLYPGPGNVLPLQQLGAIAGWHNASPLGTGIHPEWGVWFAYRVLVWIGVPTPNEAPALPAQSANAQPQQSASPPVSLIMGDVCLSCQSRACVSACPAEAIEFNASPNMDACARYRLSENSQCADRCKSREACPAGRADRQYSRAQINYHYRVALKGLANYYGVPSSDQDNS